MKSQGRRHLQLVIKTDTEAETRSESWQFCVVPNDKSTMYSLRLGGAVRGEEERQLKAGSGGP